MNIEKLNSYCPSIKDNPLFFYLLFKKNFFIQTVLDRPYPLVAERPFLQPYLTVFGS